MDNRTIDEVRRNEDRLINKIELLEKENQGLKKQLEINNDVFMTSAEESCELFRENYELKKQLETKENQQKEFIEYLQNNIESLEFCDNEFILSNHKKEIKAYKEILSKYKEIVGDK